MMKPLLILTLLAVQAFSARGDDTNAYSVYLVEVDMNLPDLANGCASWGDYNQDGFVDLVFGGRGSNGLQAAIYRNEGGLVYSNIFSGFSGAEASSADWADADLDGDLDLIFCGFTSNQTHTTQVFRYDGGDSFTEITNHGLPEISSGSVQWGDYDGDGLPDAALCGYQAGGTNIARVYRNLGGWTFSSNPFLLPGVRDGRLAWGDFNNDGLSDLLLYGDTGSGRITKGYRNENGSSFSNSFSSIPGLGHGSIDWVDFNGDGYEDLSLAGYTGSGPMGRLYRNVGPGSYAYQLFSSNTPAACWLGASAWGDYDNDGDSDLLVGGIATNGVLLTRLYTDTKNGTLTPVNIALPPLKQSCAQWVDLNGDDALDLFLCGRDTNGLYQTYTFVNRVSVTNTPPGAPSNLCAVVTNGFDLCLTWDPAQDGQTPSTGLYYNVFVGTAPDRADLVSPMADVETGRRYPCRLVNGTHARVRLVRRVPAAVPLYWGVQAVDANGLGGAFARGEPITRPAYPDFAVTGIAVQDIPYTITVTVSNAGLMEADAGLLAFWQDSPAVPQGADGADRTLSVGRLSAGAATNIVFTDFASPSSVKTKEMRARINADEAFQEETQTNNQASLLNTPMVHEEFQFSAVALNDRVSLRWSDPIASGLESPCVHVRYSTTGYPDTLSDGELLYEGTNRTFQHIPVTNRTCYYTIWVSQDGVHFITPPSTNSP